MKIISKTTKKYVWESFFYISFLFAISFLLPNSFWGYWRVEPHPYIFVVFFFALKYGAFASLISTLISLAFFFAASFLVAENPLSIYSLKIASILLFVSYVFGEMTRRNKVENATLLQKNEGLQKELQRFDKENTIYQKVNNELEERILSNTNTFSNIFHSIQHFSFNDLNENYTRILEVVQEYTSAEECTLYLLEDKKLYVGKRRGCSTLIQRRDIIEIEKDKSIISKVIKDKKAYSVRDFVHHSSFGQFDVLGETVMAAPILSEDNTVIGVINIEQLPFIKLTQPTFNLFIEIVKWSSLILQYNKDFLKLQTQNSLDSLFNINKYSYFVDRLQEEIQRNGRMKTFFSLAHIKVTYPETLTKKQVIVHKKCFIECVKNCTDLLDIFSLSDTDDCYYLLMPQVEKKELSKKIDQIKVTLKELDLKVKLNYITTESKKATAKYTQIINSLKRI